jgi:hypothetical protein
VNNTYSFDLFVCVCFENSIQPSLVGAFPPRALEHLYIETEPLHHVYPQVRELPIPEGDNLQEDKLRQGGNSYTWLTTPSLYPANAICAKPSFDSGNEKQDHSVKCSSSWHYLVTWRQGVLQGRFPSTSSRARVNECGSLFRAKYHLQVFQDPREEWRKPRISVIERRPVHCP